MRLENSYERKKNKTKLKNTNTWRLNNTLLNNQEITEEIKEEIKKYLETNDNENTMIKGSNQEEDIKIVNIYALNIGAPQYIRQMLIAIKEVDSNTILMGDFNATLTSMD